MNKHTVSLKLAKKMKKLGWEKETLFWWDDHSEIGEGFILTSEPEMDYCPAPIASEILEEMPEFVFIHRENAGYSCHRNPDDKITPDFTEDTPAEALGEMYCYLKENKLI